MIWLPTKIYESLPVLYVTVGVLFLIGASYVGFDHGIMQGYVTLGLSCVLGGICVTYIRHRARSQAEPHLSLADRIAT